MESKLTQELFWLGATVTMTALFWVPYILNRLHEQGILAALTDPSGSTHTEVKWAYRMMRAHENAVEHLVIFAPLVLALHVVGVSNAATVMACMVYFFARALHFAVFTFGVPYLRVVTFLVGVAAQLVLAYQLLVVV